MKEEKKNKAAITHINDLRLLLANNLKIPLPNLRRNGLADAAENPEMLHLGPDVLVASALQQTQSRGRHVEMRNLVLLNNVPVPRKRRVGRRAFKDDRRNTKKERCIDDICVAGNPTNVAAAEVAVPIVDIEDVLSRGRRTHEVSARRMHDTLGLPRRAGGVEEEKRVLRVDGNGREVGGPLLDLLVPPKVAALGEGDVGAGALVHQDVRHAGALLQGVVDDLLGADQLAAALPLVRGDDDPAAGIDDAVAEGVGREAGEDDRMDGAETGAGQHGDNSFGDHGHVDGDGVALADAHLLERPGDLRDVPQELAIGDITAVGGLVGLVSDGDPVGIFEGVSVDQVVACVQGTLDEPRVVAALKTPGAYGLEIRVPGDELAGLGSPEFGRIGD